MLYTIAIILFILWLLGLVTTNVLGGFVHLLLIAAVVVGFCETLTLLSLYGTILLEAENEKKITREFKETDYIRAKDARFGKVYTAVVVVCLLLFNAWVIFFS